MFFLHVSGMLEQKCVSSVRQICLKRFFLRVSGMLENIFLRVSGMLENIFLRVSGILENKCFFVCQVCLKRNGFFFACVRYA